MTSAIVCTNDQRRAQVNFDAFLCVITLVLASSVLTEAQGNQPLLQITSPTSGSVISAGQSVSVAVTSPANIPFTQVFVVGEDPLGMSDAASTAPAQFSLTIPNQVTARKYLLTAWAATTLGDVVQSDPITIDIERSDVPTKLTVEPPEIIFESQGEELPMRLWGKFADGSILERLNAA